MNIQTNVEKPALRHLATEGERPITLVSTGQRPRSCHLIDIENQVGGPAASVEDIQRWWQIYRDEAVGIRPGDQVIVGASHFAAKNVWFALPMVGIQRRVKSGPDGAETAILDALDLDHLSRSFYRLVIASSDHFFAAIAYKARALGMEVHMVIGRGVPSRALLAACPTHTFIRTSPRVVRAYHVLAA